MPTLILALAAVAQAQAVATEPTGWLTIFIAIAGALGTIASGIGGGALWQRRRGQGEPTPVVAPAHLEAEDSVRSALRENSELTEKNAEAIHDTATTMQALTTALEASNERAKEWQERTREWQRGSDDKLDDIKERLMELAADVKAQRPR